MHVTAPNSGPLRSKFTQNIILIRNTNYISGSGMKSLEVEISPNFDHITTQRGGFFFCIVNITLWKAPLSTLQASIP